MDRPTKTLKKPRGPRAALALLGLAALAQAHVKITAPSGGEILRAGQSLSITWEADDHDCVYNLYFSADSGKTWSTIVLNLAQTVRTYRWTVPDQPTTKGMVRVFQDNRTGTDTEGKSKVFTVQPPTGILTLRPRIAFSPDPEAVDLRGRTLAAQRSNPSPSIKVPWR